MAIESGASRNRVLTLLSPTGAISKSATWGLSGQFCSELATGDFGSLKLSDLNPRPGLRAIGGLISARL